MSVAAVLLPVAQLVGAATDRTPKDEDVKAGWTAFVLFLLLVAAVVVLAFSLVKQLRKAQAAKDAGVYDDGDGGDDGDGDGNGGELADGTPDPENHATS